MQPLVWDALRPAPGAQTRESEAREKHEPGFVPNNSPMSYHQVCRCICYVYYYIVFFKKGGRIGSRGVLGPTTAPP